MICQKCFSEHEIQERCPNCGWLEQNEVPNQSLPKTQLHKIALNSESKIEDAHAIELLNELIKECATLAHRDFGGLIILQGKIKLFILNYVNDNSVKINELEKMQFFFFPKITKVWESVEDAYSRAWQSGIDKLIVFLNEIHAEISFVSRINFRRPKSEKLEHELHNEIYYQIGGLISDNHVEKALESLTFWYEKIDRFDLRDAVTILRSRYEQIKMMEIKGIVSLTEVTIEQTKIKEAILQLVKLNNSFL